MKPGKLVIATIVIVAIVLLGTVTAGLVTGRAILGSEPAAVQTSTPTPAPTPAPTPEPTPTLVPLDLPEPPDKSQSPASLPTERSTKGTRSEQAVRGEGTVYTWEDGDRTTRVVLQTDLAVQETASIAPEDVVVARGAKDSIVLKQDKNGGDAGPVFRSESGGGLMTLPGGVLLALDPGWDQARVDDFFSRNNISRHRTSELEFLPNGFLVDTEPGLSSLELANALADQDGVVAASPNWWTEVEAK